MPLTEWLEGTAREPAICDAFVTVDATEVVGHDREALVSELAGRLVETKSSRDYIETFAPRLGWSFVSQRLAGGPIKVRRGDFGEVVAVGWLEDFGGLAVPVKKLRFQINPGQTLPGTDAVAFAVDNGAIVSATFLESKLRTTSAFLSEVATKAYDQLVADRVDRFGEILQYVHEILFARNDPMLDALTEFLVRRGDDDDDSHAVVLVVEEGVWSDELLNDLAENAGDLPDCTVHVLLGTGLADLIDRAFSTIGAELVSAEPDEE